jgi:myo-inositol-1-phosphate synthase
MSARTGLWFVGARGSVAVTSTVGALALRAGLAPDTGLVSSLPQLAAAQLAEVADLVVGGHDISCTPLAKRAEALADAGVLPNALVPALARELDEVDSRIRDGIHPGEESQLDACRRVESDLRSFRETHCLARVVVVDVSSTEPPGADHPELESLAALEAALDRGEAPLSTSSVYAYAAFRAGCPVVAFTPSPGPKPAALRELAERHRVPWAGCDGKTGETLVKATLAPMFASRALRVRSWASYNMLGGGDGETLADPSAAASKTASKAKGLEAILGHPVDGPLHIDYVPDLGDWKTAWDHISFEGFLGTRMSLQFTWAGCDSALAAPLVLDLVRLVARAHEVGEHGPVPELAFFFKDPVGTDEHRLSAQFDLLTGLAERLGAAA